MNLILKSGTEIPIVDGSLTGAVVLTVENKEALLEIWNQLTPDELHEVRISNGSTVLRTMYGVVVDSIQAVPNPDGDITVHIYMHETVTGNITTDAEYVQAAKILLGEER